MNNPCPNCGNDNVPDTGWKHATGIGDPRTGEMHLQPNRQHATCPNCGVKLVRNPDDGDLGLDRWRVDRP